MPAVLPGGGATREQQISYYAGILSRLPGTYQGSYTVYDGMTWSQLYTELADSDASADPETLAGQVLGLETAQQLGRNVSGAGGFLGKYVKASENALADTNFAAGVPGLSGIAAIGDFFTRLEEAATWERVLEVVLGVALIGIGAAHLFHLKVPKVVPV